MFRSIRWRIAFPYVLLIVFTMSGLGLYLSSYIRQSHQAELETSLIKETRLIGDSLGIILARNSDRPDLDDLARHWSGLFDGRVTLISADGTVIGESHEDRTRMDNHLDRVEVQQALAEGLGKSIRYSQTTGYDMLYIASPVSVDGQVVAVARLALPLGQIEQNVAHLQRTFLGTTLLAITLALIIAILIANQVTHPLRSLSQTARQLSTGDREQTLVPPTDDEVGQFAKAFNLRTLQLQSQMEALKSESLKLQSVLQQMTDGVLIVDAQGRVQLANAASERMFEFEEGQVMGRSLAEALRHFQIVELWRNTLQSGESQIAALEFGPKRLSLQCIASPLGSTLPGSTLLLFQDLTRLRQLETVRRDFISNISHELRTPLASLKALTETLQDTALDDPPAARRFLERMDMEVDALAQMVSELLELARIESGKVLLHFKPATPADMVNPAFDRMQLQAERAGVRIELDCPADLPHVLADPPRMLQVLVNLLHNAIKFTPPGGKITLRVRAEGEQVIFGVIDTGVGIPQEDLSRIFERFFKSDRARTGGGTGLGLAIAKHLVEAHGGRIWADSVETRGSSFYFSLPAFSNLTPKSTT